MQTITTQRLQSLIENKTWEYILIDIREQQELKNGIIPTSKNIPFDELKNALQLSEEKFELKYNFKKPLKSDRVIFYCRTGTRAEIATKIALTLGFNAILYEESIWEWSQIDSNVRRY